MPNRTKDIVNKFITEISKLLGERIKKIILYGSYARGDFDKNSDIDIMILTDLNDVELIENRMKIRDIACDLELEYDITISPVVRNIEKYNARVDFKKHKDVLAYFNQNYIKTEIFPRMISKKISQARKVREDSDYDDEFVPTDEETWKRLFIIY